MYARTAGCLGMLLSPLCIDGMLEFVPVVCFLLELLEIDGGVVVELFGSFLVIKVGGTYEVQKLFVSVNVAIEVLFELLYVLYANVNE